MDILFGFFIAKHVKKFWEQAVYAIAAGICSSIVGSILMHRFFESADTAGTIARVLVGLLYHPLIALIALLLFRTVIKHKSCDSTEVNETGNDGTTPLMLAAMLGKIKKIQKLVAAGANLDAVDDRGWTSLMYAASRNEYEAVKTLLDLGASAILKDMDNKTAVDIARDKNNIESMDVINRYIITNANK